MGKINTILSLEQENEELRYMLNAALEVCCPNNCEDCYWSEYCDSEHGTE